MERQQPVPMLDSILCRLRCQGTPQDIATASWIYVPRMQETDLGRKYVLQNQVVIKDMIVDKHS